ncbi:MAG: ribonuclease P protein component [Bacteroidales bacterium]|nr:ribonuclease P protein component [Bacteroidales bacterium]
MQQKEDSSKRQFSFPKKERICSKIILDRLLHKQQVIFTFPFKCYYDIEPCDSADTKNVMAVGVPKKRLKRAVDRNLMKRRIREAYRLNKHLIESLPTVHGKSASLFFVFVGNETLPFNFINDKIILVLNRLLSDNIENIDNKV